MENNLSAIFQASYEDPKIAAKTLSEKGYNFDTQLSTPESKVFVDEQGNAHIAFRGTHRVSDVLTDIGVGLGIKTKRQKDAKDLAKRVQDKYKGRSVSAYGTSLGGNLAENAGVSGNVVTYNKATGIRDIFRSVPKTQFDYRTEKDIISLPSLLQRGGNKITLKSNKSDSILKAHSISSFDPKKKTTIKSINPLSAFF
jgi:hypothetical protein